MDFFFLERVEIICCHFVFLRTNYRIHVIACFGRFRFIRCRLLAAGEKASNVMAKCTLLFCFQLIFLQCLWQQRIPKVYTLVFELVPLMFALERRRTDYRNVYKT